MTPTHTIPEDALAALTINAARFDLELSIDERIRFFDAGQGFAVRPGVIVEHEKGDVRGYRLDVATGHFVRLRGVSRCVGCGNEPGEGAEYAEAEFIGSRCVQEAGWFGCDDCRAFHGAKERSAMEEAYERSVAEREVWW